MKSEDKLLISIKDSYLPLCWWVGRWGATWGWGCSMLLPLLWFGATLVDRCCQIAPRFHEQPAKKVSLKRITPRILFNPISRNLVFNTALTIKCEKCICSDNYSKMKKTIGAPGGLKTENKRARTPSKMPYWWQSIQESCRECCQWQQGNTLPISTLVGFC